VRVRGLHGTLVGVILVAVAAFLFGCGTPHRSASQPPEVPLASTVTTSIFGTVMSVHPHFLVVHHTCGNCSKMFQTLRINTSSKTTECFRTCGGRYSPSTVKVGDRVTAWIENSRVAQYVDVNTVAGWGNLVSVTSFTSVMQQTNSGGTLHFTDVRLNVGDMTNGPEVGPHVQTTVLVAGNRVHYTGSVVGSREGLRTVDVHELT
jgi:hypothetical protein